MNASQSSVSPQRRISGNTAGSPYSANQQTFSYSHPLPSPQSYGQGDSSYLQGLVTPYSTSSNQAQGYKSRARGSAQHSHYRYSGSGGALPTPDTTLASISVISDEDVARQLMRLGDASNFSTHGRTSTSTLDDAFSGKAAASSSESSQDGIGISSCCNGLSWIRTSRLIQLLSHYTSKRTATFTLLSGSTLFQRWLPL